MEKKYILLIIPLIVSTLVSATLQQYEAMNKSSNTLTDAKASENIKEDFNTRDTNGSIIPQGMDEILLKDNLSIKCRIISADLNEIIYIPANEPDSKSIPVDPVNKNLSTACIIPAMSSLSFSSNGFLSFSVKSFDSEYKKKNFVLTAFSGMTDLGLKINKSYHYEIMYAMDETWTYGMSISYRGLGFSFVKSETNPDTEYYLPGDPGTNLYAKDIDCDYNDFQLFYYSSQHGLDLVYLDYKGFRLENAERFDQNQMTDSVFNRGDLRIRYFRLDYYYSFNRDFSLAAAFRQTEIHQSGFYGSFLVMLSSLYWDISADYSLIVPEVETYYGEYAGLHDSSNLNLSILPGYALSVTFREITVTFCGFIGPGYSSQTYETASGKKKYNGYLAKKNLKTNWCVNFDSFFFGWWAVGDGSTTNDNKSDVISLDLSDFKIECYAGFRF